MDNLESNFMDKIPVWFHSLQRNQEFDYNGYRCMKINGYQYILTEESKNNAAAKLRQSMEHLIKAEQERLNELERDFEAQKIDLDNYQFNYDRFTKKLMEHQYTLENIGMRINSVFCFGV